MHYSRVSTPASQTYSAATAVLMTEILKGLISFIIAYWRVEIPPPITPFTPDVSQPRPRNLVSKMKKLMSDLFSADCWKLSIPAILYGTLPCSISETLFQRGTVIQNNLQFVAASNLEVATFQVTYQMKILTTAGFSVLLLRKKLTSKQWVALLFLAVGVAIVQIQGIASTTFARQDMDGLKGFLAVCAACFTSGLAGVYFEMVLKNSHCDLWVRNLQLSLFSLPPAIMPVLLGRVGMPSGGHGWFTSLFHNFGVWAWLTVGIQVLGGLLTAMVIKYSDNILKGFATSLSIVLSFLASVVLFDFHITFSFLLGSAIVMNATWLYNHHGKRSNPKDSIGLLRTWNEKWKGTTGSSSRSASLGDTGVVLTSSLSRSPSVVSLTSLSPNTPPPVSESESNGLLAR